MFGKKKDAASAGEGVVAGLFGNQTIARLAFGKAKDWFAKEGITAVIVRIDETATDTDGIRMEAFKSGVIVLSGEDAARLSGPIKTLLSMTDEQIAKLLSHD